MRDAEYSTSTHHPWLIATENVFGHLAAIVVGAIMMIVGLGLGVTIVMLPVGLVVGLSGVAVFIAGIFGHFRARGMT